MDNNTRYRPKRAVGSVTALSMTRYLGAVLKAQGFQVNYLHNQDATRDGILKAVKKTFLEQGIRRRPTFFTSLLRARPTNPG